MINNLTNINKTIRHPSPQTVEHEHHHVVILMV